MFPESLLLENWNHATDFSSQTATASCCIWACVKETELALLSLFCSPSLSVWTCLTYSVSLHVWWFWFCGDPECCVCLQEGKTLFEQELYHSFSVNSSRSYFISFAGDVSVISVFWCSSSFWAEISNKALHQPIWSLIYSSSETTFGWYEFSSDVSQRWNSNDPHVLLQTCQVGLNFASEEEARRFRNNINDLLNRRQRKTGLVLSLCFL